MPAFDRSPVDHPPGLARSTRVPADGVAYAALLREVRSAGLLAKRPGYYLAVAAVSAVLGACSLLALLLGPSPWQLAGAILLGLVQGQFAFLAHEAAHRQVFRRGPLNDQAARVVGGVMVGLGLSWWQRSHVRHHAYPNTVDEDPSLESALFAFHPGARTRRGLVHRFQRVQGWLLLPLLCAEGVDLRVRSVLTLLAHPRRKEQWMELALILVRLVTLPVIVLLLLPGGLGALFLVLQSAVFGLYVGGSFVPNHVGMPILRGRHGLDYLRRQVATSRNLRGGVVLGLLAGGLDLQIEHHLFPGMPRPGLRRAQPIVKEHCRALGIHYHETTLVAAYRDVVKALNTTGRGRPTFRCPIVDRCGQV